MIKKKKSTCRIDDFVVPVNHRVKIKESEKKKKEKKRKGMYLDRQITKKAMEYEGDGDSSCNWFVKIGQNTEKSPGGPRRLAIA